MDNSYGQGVGDSDPNDKLKTKGGAGHRLPPPHPKHSAPKHQAIGKEVVATSNCIGTPPPGMGNPAGSGASDDSF